jgi:diguanylate cyclase (GGDEF)-like protein
LPEYGSARQRESFVRADKKRKQLNEKDGVIKMTLDIAQVFDDYPNPFFVVRPILSSGRSEDFEYVYVNDAFCIFLGRSRKELEGKRFLDNFEKGERDWLDLFTNVAYDKKHRYTNNISTLAGKKLFTESFCIEPGMCGCIIHDFQSIPAYMTSSDVREMRHRANYDYLTGFYNRYYLKEQTAEIMRHKNVGIVFLDINNLKLTNDRSGHEAGDELIKLTSDMLRLQFGDAMIFRMGGDEFVAVCLGKTREDFMALAEDCRQFFEQQNTAAVGYEFFEEVEDLQKCISICDKKMYIQKGKMKKSAYGE